MDDDHSYTTIQMHTRSWKYILKRVKLSYFMLYVFEKIVLGWLKCQVEQHSKKIKERKKREKTVKESK
jgi:hypothetical protein